jgi:hypothetical protein
MDALLVVITRQYPPSEFDIGWARWAPGQAACCMLVFDRGGEVLPPPDIERGCLPQGASLLVVKGDAGQRQMGRVDLIRGLGSIVEAVARERRMYLLIHSNVPESLGPPEDADAEARDAWSAIRQAEQFRLLWSNGFLYSLGGDSVQRRVGMTVGKLCKGLKFSDYLLRLEGAVVEVATTIPPGYQRTKALATRLASPKPVRAQRASQVTGVPAAPVSADSEGPEGAVDSGVRPDSLESPAEMAAVQGARGARRQTPRGLAHDALNRIDPLLIMLEGWVRGGCDERDWRDLCSRLGGDVGRRYDEARELLRAVLSHPGMQGDNDAWQGVTSAIGDQQWQRVQDLLRLVKPDDHQAMRTWLAMHFQELKTWHMGLAANLRRLVRPASGAAHRAS